MLLVKPKPAVLALEAVRERDILSKIKKGENYNHRNTSKYFEDYNLSLTQRLGKIAILGQPPCCFRSKCGIFGLH